jgi:hypothetical protein
MIILINKKHINTIRLNIDDQQYLLLPETFIFKNKIDLENKDITTIDFNITNTSTDDLYKKIIRNSDFNNISLIISSNIELDKLYLTEVFLPSENKFINDKLDYYIINQYKRHIELDKYEHEIILKNIVNTNEKIQNIYFYLDNDHQIYINDYHLYNTCVFNWHFGLKVDDKIFNLNLEMPCVNDNVLYYNIKINKNVKYMTLITESIKKIELKKL